MLEDIRGLEFRRLNDADGDTGPFLILLLADERKAARAAEKLVDAGLHNVFQISEYGLHIYSNIPSLVNKVGVTDAGDPWALVENQKSVYDYNKGACQCRCSVRTFSAGADSIETNISTGEIRR